MKSLKKYYYVFFISVCIFVILVIMNVNIIKKVEKGKKTEEHNKKTAELKSKKIEPIYGYAEIIKELTDNNFIILHINDDKKNSIFVSTEFSGSLKELNNYIDKLNDYKNFTGIDNITINGKENKITAEMSFFKSK